MLLAVGYAEHGIKFSIVCFICNFSHYSEPVRHLVSFLPALRTVLADMQIAVAWSHFLQLTSMLLSYSMQGCKVPNVSLAQQDLLQQFPLLCNVLGALSITTASSLWAIPLILHALTISCIATVGSPPSGFLAGLYNKQSRSFVQWHQLYVSFGL